MVCFLTHNINELIITNSYGYANIINWYGDLITLRQIYI